MTDKDIFLKAYKEAVIKVESEITQSTSYLAKTFPHNDLFYNEVGRFIASGGKRFRPALSYVVADSFGHKDIFPHLALETFHKYLLAHDDIIDRDDIRYGTPTLHAKMTAVYADSEDKAHLGTSLAIIGGDLIEAATHKIILNADLSADVKISLQKLIVQAVEEVSWGWYDQFLMDYLSLDSDLLSFERIEKSIIWVTGKYSIKLPLLFGFAVADTNPPAGLEKLADTLGALYQTGDDLIGLFGDEKTTGKSNFGDIVQGKKTLPMWFTFKNASAKDQIKLTAVVGNKDATTSDIEEVRHIIRRSGGMEHTRELMNTYGQNCREAVELLDVPSDLKHFLRGFVDFIEKRDR